MQKAKKMKKMKLWVGNQKEEKTAIVDVDLNVAGPSQQNTKPTINLWGMGEKKRKGLA